MTPKPGLGWVQVVFIAAARCAVEERVAGVERLEPPRIAGVRVVDLAIQEGETAEACMFLGSRGLCEVVPYFWTKFRHVVRDAEVEVEF